MWGLSLLSLPSEGSYRLEFGSGVRTWRGKGMRNQSQCRRERVIRSTPEEEQLKALGVFLLEKRDEAVILKREEERLPCSVLYPPRPPSPAVTTSL